ncbi:MAG: RNase adapter RapZ [Gammaproteobacteria bacterium]|nr:RNase adapter RapZ [Gammaproteobacteria bacterium]
MRLVILSGLSGSGKSIALNTLEDQGFYCIDNLPTGLLLPLIESLKQARLKLYNHVAVGIDARSDANELQNFPSTVETLKTLGVHVEVVFLHSEIKTLLLRFSETRRKHPLSQRGIPLLEAVEVENVVLGKIRLMADLIIDSSSLSLYQLRNLIVQRLLPKTDDNLSLLVQSFGFKKGVPGDSDFVYDVRCLPNPYWEPLLRESTGRDQDVADYLSQFDEVNQMFEQIRCFLESWIPCFQRDKRSYLTVSIGCTGGQHRSVFLSEKLYLHFRERIKHVALRHRELE